jgi:hypothetical protein
LAIRMQISSLAWLLAYRFAGKSMHNTSRNKKVWGVTMFFFKCGAK